MLKLPKKIIRTVRPYKYSPLRRFLEPRRFQAYCIGINKSGTHSLARMFEKHYRSGHEIDHGSLINGFLNWQKGIIKEEDFQNLLLDYNKYGWLEMDSSHVHIEYVDFLVKLFPKACFILTIRDCYSWLDSFFNHCLNYPIRDRWARLHNWRYGQSNVSYHPAEQVLQTYGFYPLGNYFAAWTTHNYRALQVIPSEQLLVLRTSEITTNLDRIANFLDIPVSTLDTRTTHSFQAPQKHHILTRIDPDYVREQAEKHCSELMIRFFDDKDYLEQLLAKSPKHQSN